MYLFSFTFFNSRMACWVSISIFYFLFFATEGDCEGCKTIITENGDAGSTLLIWESERESEPGLGIINECKWLYWGKVKGLMLDENDWASFSIEGDEML